MAKHQDVHYLEKRGTTRRDFLKISGLSVGALATGAFADLPLGYAKAKEVYPSGRIAYVVPNAPGGGYDIIGRAIGPFLTKYLRILSPGATGGGIVVKNEERKGYRILAAGKPDGYMIGMMDSTPYIETLLGTADVDFTKYTFLQSIVSTTKIVVANKKGFGSWNEVMDAMKKETIRMGVGFFGRGNHVCGIIANEKMGTKFKLIPFRGTAESMGALIRGDVGVVMVSEDSAKSLIDAKEVKVLLSFSDHTDHPGAVSAKELGFPDLVDEVSSHRFIIAPPNLEAGPKRLLLAALKKACDDPEFIAWAKRANYPIKRVYGADAEKFFLKFTRFYQSMLPVLKKNLS
ncbi:MAG: twin-arginine translocation signal domain-containing protein [Deltaproteobacteria bacterium]|nr:twin-arginine translocation signal domain-containing protein [Deltaproteobacteria bacterium]